MDRSVVEGSTETRSRDAGTSIVTSGRRSKGFDGLLAYFASESRWETCSPGRGKMNRPAYIALAAVLGLCASSCRTAKPVAADPLAQAYDAEADWNEPQHIIALNYVQAQG